MAYNFPKGIKKKIKDNIGMRNKVGKIVRKMRQSENQTGGYW